MPAAKRRFVVETDGRGARLGYEDSRGVSYGFISGHERFEVASFGEARMPPLKKRESSVVGDH